MNAVVDTNVLYAAFVSVEGTCARVLESLIDGQSLVLSEYILAELKQHLTAKERLHEDLVDRQVTVLRASATMVTPVAVEENACPDPDDLPVLGTLLAAEADCLVTGDKVLLKLKTFNGHRIVSPREFLDSLPSAAPPSAP